MAATAIRLTPQGTPRGPRKVSSSYVQDRLALTENLNTPMFKAGWLLGAITRSYSGIALNQPPPITHRLEEELSSELLLWKSGHHRLAEYVKEGQPSLQLPQILAGNIYFPEPVFLPRSRDLSRGRSQPRIQPSQLPSNYGQQSYYADGQIDRAQPKNQNASSNYMSPMPQQSAYVPEGAYDDRNLESAYVMTELQRQQEAAEQARAVQNAELERMREAGGTPEWVPQALQNQPRPAATQASPRDFLYEMLGQEARPENRLQRDIAAPQDDNMFAPPAPTFRDASVQVPAPSMVNRQPQAVPIQPQQTQSPRAGPPPLGQSALPQRIPSKPTTPQRSTSQERSFGAQQQRSRDQLPKSKLPTIKERPGAVQKPTSPAAAPQQAPQVPQNVNVLLTYPQVSGQPRDVAQQQGQRRPDDFGNAVVAFDPNRQATGPQDRDSLVQASQQMVRGDATQGGQMAGDIMGRDLSPETAASVQPRLRPDFQKLEGTENVEYRRKRSTTRDMVPVQNLTPTGAPAIEGGPQQSQVVPYGQNPSGLQVVPGGQVAQDVMARDVTSRNISEPPVPKLMPDLNRLEGNENIEYRRKSSITNDIIPAEVFRDAREGRPEQTGSGQPGAQVVPHGQRPQTPQRKTSQVAQDIVNRDLTSDNPQQAPGPKLMPNFTKLANKETVEYRRKSSITRELDAKGVAPGHVFGRRPSREEALRIQTAQQSPDTTGPDVLMPIRRRSSQDAALKASQRIPSNHYQQGQRSTDQVSPYSGDGRRSSASNPPDNAPFSFADAGPQENRQGAVMPFQQDDQAGAIMMADDPEVQNRQGLVQQQLHSPEMNHLVSSGKLGYEYIRLRTIETTAADQQRQQQQQQQQQQFQPSDQPRVSEPSTPRRQSADPGVEEQRRFSDTSRSDSQRTGPRSAESVSTAAPLASGVSASSGRGTKMSGGSQSSMPQRPFAQGSNRRMQAGEGFYTPNSFISTLTSSIATSGQVPSVTSGKSGPTKPYSSGRSGRSSSLATRTQSTRYSRRRASPYDPHVEPDTPTSATEIYLDSRVISLPVGCRRSTETGRQLQTGIQPDISLMHITKLVKSRRRSSARASNIRRHSD